MNNTLKVILILAVGLGVIIYLNPPHTPCKSEHELFKESFKQFTPAYAKSLQLCKTQPDQGGCTSLFEVVGKIESKLKDMGQSCKGELDNDTPLRNYITLSMEIMVRSAWGSKPPASYHYRNGWLETSHVVLFCKLRSHLNSIFGEDAWLSFIESTLSDLPGASELGRNEAWNRSLLSDPCKYIY